MGLCKVDCAAEVNRSGWELWELYSVMLLLPVSDNLAVTRFCCDGALNNIRYSCDDIVESPKDIGSDFLLFEADEIAQIFIHVVKLCWQFDRFIAFLFAADSHRIGLILLGWRPIYIDDQIVFVSRKIGVANLVSLSDVNDSLLKSERSIHFEQNN